jgi:multidrug resistance protein
MSAPGVPQMLADFKTDSTLLATFVISVFVLGFAFGPLVIAPLSETLGRVPVYHVCNILFLVFTVLCAVSKSMAMLIVFRFLAGFAGVAPITCGGGTIADLMPPERRGIAMSLWSLGPLFGPIIGPIAGGFLVEAKDWRWVFWVIAIVVRIYL